MRIVTILSFLLIISSCKKLEIERINKLVTTDVVWENNTLIVHCDLVDIEQNTEIVYGICYAIDHTPFIQTDSVVILGVTNRPLRYSAKIPEILLGLNYYVRAFTKIGEEVIYGEAKGQYTRLSNIKLEVSIPGSPNSKKVDVLGKISNLGDLKIKEFGHCYGTKINPTIYDSKIVANLSIISGQVNFVSSFVNPPKDTFNNVRSYVILDDDQVFYSDNIFFHLKSHKLTILSLSKINNEQDLKMTAMFTQLGTDSISEYGFCWATSTNNPSINTNRVIVQSLPNENQVFTGTYKKVSNSNVLTYYVRPYVISSNEVIYGGVLNLNY